MKAVEHKHDHGMAAEKQHEQRTVKQQGHRVVVAQATLHWRQEVQNAALPRLRQTEQRPGGGRFEKVENALVGTAL